MRWPWAKREEPPTRPRTRPASHVYRVLNDVPAGTEFGVYWGSNVIIGQHPNDGPVIVMAEWIRENPPEVLP